MTPLLRKRVASGKLPKRDKGAVAGDQEVEQSSESEFDPTATTRGVVTQNHAPGRSTEDDQFMNTGAPTRGRASHERRIQCPFIGPAEKTCAMWRLQGGMGLWVWWRTVMVNATW